MVQKRTLLTVDVVTDDSTGMYRMGEIDFGICTGLVEDHLKRYGKKGQVEIINTLAYLIGAIAKMEAPLTEEEKASCPVANSAG